MSNISNAMWYADNGNNTYAINYPLHENSIVVDLGAFTGKWASQIIDKYNPFVFLLEPIPQFYNELVNTFNSNPKVRVLNAGISTYDHLDKLFINADGTSKYINTHLTPIDVNMISINSLLKIVGSKIDLVQINIEGEEYDILDKMLEDETIESFLHLQIQFHDWFPNAHERRSNIQNKLSVKFNKIYDYPFVFEGWALKNNTL